VQRRRAFEDRERDKVSEQRKFEESLRDRQMRVRLKPVSPDACIVQIGLHTCCSVC
jgi:hypothetical protein